MPLFRDVIYPRAVERICGAADLTELRRRWVGRAQGDVLEVGLGAGHNLELLDPARVRSVVGVEPSAGLRTRAATRAAAAPLPVTVLDGTAEALPFDAGRFDTVLLTYTLCSVTDPVAALSELRRVLRPGGQLVFLEHGLGPSPRQARWQRRVTPLWRRVSGNCHFDRDVAALVGAAFTIVELDGHVSSRLSYVTGGVAT
jgi:ubiquinone/menaquinone biosynthesis C-methylase UbiE